MTIGFATTAYDTHFNYLAEPDHLLGCSSTTVINEMRENDATFEDALAEIEKYYGLTTEEGQDLTLTEAEIESLTGCLRVEHAAQRRSACWASEEALLYGGYEPLSMAVCHIINNKAGLSFTSYAHTGLQIPVYAMGVGADNFAGLYDNTDIFTKTMAGHGPPGRMRREWLNPRAGCPCGSPHSLSKNQGERANPIRASIVPGGVYGGDGAILRRKIPFSRAKIASLQFPRSKIPDLRNR